MSHRPGRLLLASIHDVTPRFETEVDGLLDLLAPHVGSQLAMLVVPNHWSSAPIVPGSAFATRLRNWADQGVEMFLHGFTHRDEAQHDGKADRLRARFMTASEGEFLGLTYAQSLDRFERGRGLIEGVIGRPIDGFVAPAWLYSDGAREALRDAGVTLAEDHLRVWSPASGRVLATGPVITWASRTRRRLASSLAAAATLRHLPLKVLRVGVHPPDVHHPSLIRSIDKTLRIAAASRRVGRYADLAAFRRRDFQYSIAASASSGRAK
jgi:predicted deacetylase